MHPERPESQASQAGVKSGVQVRGLLVRKHSCVCLLCAFRLTARTEALQREFDLELGCYGNVLTMKAGKCYERRLFVWGGTAAH